MIKRFKSKIISIRNQKGSIITLIALFLLILENYRKHIAFYSGTDVSMMVYPMKLILMSINNVHGYSGEFMLFMYLFPVLAVLPAGFSFLEEHMTGEEAYLKLRMGHKRYIMGKLRDAFFTTTIVFLIPLLLDIFVTAATFPMSALGDQIDFGIYSKEYESQLNSYLFKDFFLSSPLLYTILYALLISMFAGLLGMLTVSISYCRPPKFRVILFLPVFLLLNLTMYIDSYMQQPGSISYFWGDYLFVFGEYRKSKVYIPVVFLSLIAATALLTFIGSRRRKNGCGIQ